MAFVGEPWPDRDQPVAPAPPDDTGGPKSAAPAVLGLLLTSVLIVGALVVAAGDWSSSRSGGDEGRGGFDRRGAVIAGRVEREVVVAEPAGPLPLEGPPVTAVPVPVPVVPPDAPVAVGRAVPVTGVLVEDGGFAPSFPQVVRGGAVVFENRTSRVVRIESAQKAFASGDIAPGDSWTLVADFESGDYPFTDADRPDVTGVLAVVEP